MFRSCYGPCCVPFTITHLQQWSSTCLFHATKHDQKRVSSLINFVTNMDKCFILFLTINITRKTPLLSTITKYNSTVSPLVRTKQDCSNVIGIPFIQNIYQLVKKKLKQKQKSFSNEKNNVEILKTYFLIVHNLIYLFLQ